MLQRWWWLALLLMSSMCSAMPTSVAVWKNAPNDATLAQAISADQQGLFKPSRGQGVSAGYNHQSHWLKVDAPSVEAYPQDTYLTVYPSYLDSIQLFYQNKTGEWQQREAGDFLPFSQRELADNRFVFQLKPNELATGSSLYVRLQTTSTSLMFIEWVDVKSYVHQSQRGFWWLGLELGVLFTLIVAQLMSGQWRRERLFRYYLFYLVVLWFTLLAQHGLLIWLMPELLPSWLAHHATSFSALAHMLAITLFYQQVLSIHRHNTPWLNGATWTMFVLLGLGFISVFVGFYVDVIGLILLVSMLLWIGFFQRSWSLMRQEHNVNQRREQQVLMAATLFAYFGNLLLVGSVLGWLPVADWLIYAVNVTLVVLVLSFQWIISHRVRLLSLQKQQVELTARETTLRLEQTLLAKEQQARLMTMLNHELKNPLSVIKMVLSGRECSDKQKGFAQAAVQDMNRILERCNYSERLDDRSLNPVFQPFNLLQSLPFWLTAYGSKVQLSLPTASDLKLYLDEELLRVIVVNLVDNALKYGDQQQPIQVTLNQSDSPEAPSVWRLTVGNAVGRFGAPNPESLFVKYYRAESTRGVQGTGLGLYLVKTLADALSVTVSYRFVNGWVWFELEGRVHDE